MDYVELFVEVGPNPVLSGMARRFIDDDGSTLWLPSARKGQDETRLVANSLGALHTRGVKLDWTKVDRDSAHRRPLSCPTYPFQRAAYWVDIEQGAGPGGVAGGGSDILNTGMITPILGVHLPSPLEEEVFITSFNTVNLGFLLGRPSR